MVSDEDLKAQAIAAVEQSGIVFLDEIDKIASRSEAQGADVSRQGVQRDLLPLIEGTSVNTRHGVVRTDHILFIASGAFHLSKPSDLIPELQGRLPIRVEMDSLSVGDFVRILTETDANLTRQYQALLVLTDRNCLPITVPITLTVTSAAPVADPELPKAVTLLGAVPNPFNPRSVIRFALPTAQSARLEIYGIDGHLVRRLLDGPVAAGVPEVTWDGRDDSGRAAASGVYVHRLVCDGKALTGKMVLAR